MAWGYSDGCIYYCIPPGNLVNNHGDDNPANDTPLGHSYTEWVSTPPNSEAMADAASVCFPTHLQGGKFREGTGTEELPGSSADNYKDSRDNPDLYCEADYFVRWTDLQTALLWKTYVYQETLGADPHERPLITSSPKYYPGCSSLVDISGFNANTSQAWTDRLYENQNTGWCRAGKCTNSAGLCRTPAVGVKYCANDPARSCVTDNDCPCSSDADCDFRVISNVGTPTSSGDYKWLNYIYGSKRDPFGYAVEVLPISRASGSSPSGPISIPYCSNPPAMRLRDAVTNSCVSGEVGTEDARPYLNFDYTTRVDCSSGGDATCNPDADCINFQCFQKCNTDADCPSVSPPSGYSPPGSPGGADPPSGGGTVPGRCIFAQGSGGQKICSGVTKTGTDTACNPSDLASSLCQTSAGGYCVGSCKNAAGSCREKSGCYSIKCRASILGGSVCEGIFFSEEVQQGTFNETWSQQSRGAERVAQLFAKSWNFWIWDSRKPFGGSDPEDYQFGNYKPERYLGGVRDAANFTPLNWDITETGGVGVPGFPSGAAISPTPPMIAPIKNPCIGDKCGVLTEGGRPIKGITVNDQSSGTVISRSGDLKADVKFFAWADKNQMPIKQICVDFAGDGSVVSSGCGSSDNFFKNYRGWKEGGSGGSECDGTDFSRASQSCTENFYSVSTTYTCRRDIGPNWELTCPDSTVSGGCCVFYPRVMVKDNWGWCNGTCSGLRPNGGCYETQCNYRGDDPHWTSFSGRVIVVPE